MLRFSPVVGGCTLAIGRFVFCSLKRILLASQCQAEYIEKAMDRPPKESKEIIKELKSWAKQRRGRPGEIAANLGVTRATVTNWLNGRRTPLLKHWFALQKFLEKIRE